MTRKNKIQEKLVASIRKTKQVAKEGKVEKSKPVAATKTATAAKPAANKKKQPRSAPQKVAQAEAGHFQTTKRIWPD